MNDMASMWLLKGRREMTLELIGLRRGRACCGVVDLIDLLIL